MKKFFAGLVVFAALSFISSPVFAQNNDKVVVYYFYTTFRCSACFYLETFTKGAVEERFADQIESGDVELKMVNINQQDNKHFIKDYGLYTKSVVLSLIKDGKEERFKNLDKVWHLLRNKAQFYQYVQEEALKFLDDLKEEKL